MVKSTSLDSTSSAGPTKDGKKAERDKREYKNQKVPRYDNYTPLNASRETILREVCNADLLRLPPRGYTPTDADLLCIVVTIVIYATTRRSVELLKMPLRS